MQWGVPKHYLKWEVVLDQPVCWGTQIHYFFKKFFCRKSALDLDPEAQAVMEMMGKTFVSKDVRAADEQNAKEKTKEEQSKN